MKTVIPFCTSFKSKNSFIDSKQSKAGGPSKAHPHSQGTADAQKRLHSRLRAVDEIIAVLLHNRAKPGNIQVFKKKKL